MRITELAGAVTGAAAALAVLWQGAVWCRRIMEGLRCQLRSEMTRIYYRHRGERVIRQYEFENFKANYAAYRALGGNSFIVKIGEEIDKWEVIS